MKTIATLRVVSVLAATALLGAWSMAAGAPPSLRGALADRAAVSDAELADMRGGFLSAAGAQFDFGASISTMVNGQLVLQTNVNWTPGGVAVQQLSGLGASIQSQVNTQVAANLAKAGISDPVTAVGTMTTSGSPTATTSGPVAATPAAAIASSAPATAANVALAGLPSAATAAGATPAQLAQASSLAASALSGLTPATAASPAVTQAATTPAAATQAALPQTTTVATIANVVPAGGAANAGSASPSLLSGVQLQSATGTTQVLTNIGANQLQNILINSASNQNITQNTNLIFTIYNFTDWQKQIAQNGVSAQLANEIMAASGLGGSR